MTQTEQYSIAGTLRQILALSIGLFLLSGCAVDSIGPDNPEISEQDVKLYYYSKRDGVNNIYKSSLEGVESVIIEDNDHHDWWVRVSPDLTKILWYKSPLDVPANQEFNNHKEAELWMANADGSDPHKVLDLTDHNWSAQGVADWSPDGTELVMAVTDETEHWHLYITKSDGTSPQRISQRNSLFADPSWSPDGQRIVYSAFPKDYVGINFFELEIHIMDRDGGNEIQLTEDEFRDHDPYWSPDGKEIAFESQWNLLHCFLGKWALRKYNFDTQATTDIVKDDDANGIPRWSKDSESLYFARTECAENSKLMKVDRDGNNMEVILSSAEFPYFDCDVID